MTPRLTCLVAALCTLLPASLQAGSFLTANETTPDQRTHPQSYTGAADNTPIRVCLDVQANEPLAIQSEAALLKVIATFNRFRSLAEHSYASGSATDVPAGQYDFESVLLHEMLHTQGLAHPHLAGDGGLPWPQSDGTRSADGIDNTMQQDAGSDGIHGSADDARGDDVNLHWYARGMNDPGRLPAVIDLTTMARSLEYLPDNHTFVANAGRDVLASLGFADAEAAVHQGAYAEEAQRHLHHDDLATLQLARAGLDGIAGTADDYGIRMEYRGREINPQGESCQIAVRFDNTTSFATTTVGTYPLSGANSGVFYARMRFNPAVNWYFSPGPNTQTQILTDLSAPGAAGQPYVVRASLGKSAGNPIAGEPRGRIELRDGPRGNAHTATCAFELGGTPGQSGECTLTPRRSGRKTVTAEYLGYGGFDASAAEATHDVAGTLAFGDLQADPATAAAHAEVSLSWTLSAGAGQSATGASGTITVKEAADCAAPPVNPAHACTVNYPANRCEIRFAGAGTKSLQFCYSGDSAFTPASASHAFTVIDGRATTTGITLDPPTSAAFQPVTAQVSVAETPSLGGHPTGTVIVSDGPALDPLSAHCTITLTGAAGDSGSCVLVPTRAGRPTVTATFATQGIWQGSSASTSADIGSFAIVRNTPSRSRAGQGVSVAVDLDVSPFLGTPAPAGAIVVSDGATSCTIVLPASECVWSGTTPGLRTLVASWPGDINYPARTSTGVLQEVEAPGWPRLASPGRTASQQSSAAANAATTLSGDGRYLVFESAAADLVTGDGNGASDIFVRDQKNGQIRRVSTGAFGEQGNGASTLPAISANGRYVAFTSRAGNLVSGDTNGQLDIFVKDLVDGGIVRATLRGDGSEDPTNNDFFGLRSTLNADGRYVVFTTTGGLLPQDTNGQSDVYVRDLVSGTVDLVSSDSQDRIADFRSGFAAISADGRHVAFGSQAFNLVPDDSNGFSDTFVKDRLTRRMVMASRGSNGEAGNSHSGADQPALSADGRYVIFASTATTLMPTSGTFSQNIYLKDLQTGVLERISRKPDGNAANGYSASPALSADGRYAVFDSESPDLVSGDNNNRWDIFVRDRQSGQITRVSVGAAGTQATDNSRRPSLSADGRYLAYESAAPNLVAGDTNGAIDVFVRDLQSLPSLRANTSGAGTHANAASGEAGLSRDGRFAVFSSAATNLIDGDSNASSDVFLYDGDSATLQALSMAGASFGNAASDSASISADGGWIVFRSAASNLVAGDGNALTDVFLRDRVSGALQRVSTGTSGAALTAGTVRSGMSLSGDGALIAFAASDTTLIAGDTNGVDDVFVKQRLGGALTLASASAAGTAGNGHSGAPALSDDGSRIAFASEASNLIASDSNGVADVFVKTLADASLLRASSDAAGVAGNGASGEPALSADGRHVAFASAASNLVPGDTNGNRDIFLKDLLDGAIVRINTTAAGVAGSGGDCGAPALSSDARHVSFTCAQDGLVPGTGAGAQVFVKDRVSGAIQRLSQNASGAVANTVSSSGARALADDGRLVFASAANNLVAGDTRPFADVFVGRFLATPLIATTTDIVSHLPSPSPLAQPYTVSVSVTRASGGDPVTGSVVVSDGSASCSATLSGSGASASGGCLLQPAAAGPRTLIARYGGDALHAASESAAVTHTAYSPQRPSAPAIIALIPGNGSVRVGFLPPASSGGSPITGFTATCGTRSASALAAPVTITGLSNGVAVTCRVFATNAAGDGPESSPSAAVTPATFPQPPTTVVAARGNGRVTLNFAAPVNNGGSAVLDYSASCANGAATATAAASPMIVAGLPNGVATTCRVKARNTVGTGAPSAESNSVTPATVPRAPTGVSAARGNAQASVTFTAPASNGGAAISGYVARCGPASGEGTASPVIVAGLINGTAVSCSVAARNSVGEGAPSAASAAIIPAGPPGAPLLLAATPSDRSVLLLFAAPSDSGGLPITGYRADCTPGTHVTTGAASPLRVENLDNGTAYHCRVAAINELGDGAVSNGIDATPRANADLSIGIDNGRDHVRGGRPVQYTIDVTGSGATAANGARVRVVLDPAFGDAHWTCSGQGGGSCAASGGGEIDERVDLPIGASVRFVLTATPAALPETPVSATATVTAPTDVTDPVAANNSATDGPDAIVVFRDGFQ